MSKPDKFIEAKAGDKAISHGKSWTGQENGWWDSDEPDEDGEYVTTPMMRESKIIQDHDDDDSNYNDSSSSESRSSCSGHFDEGTWIWDNESYWE